MTYRLHLNAAGSYCCADTFGQHDAYPTEALAAQAVRIANAQVRLRDKKRALSIAATSLGELSLRKGVTLQILPDFGFRCDQHRQEVVRA